jgi:hypothetical protein
MHYLSNSTRMSTLCRADYSSCCTGYNLACLCNLHKLRPARSDRFPSYNQCNLSIADKLGQQNKSFHSVLSHNNMKYRHWAADPDKLRKETDNFLHIAHSHHLLDDSQTRKRRIFRFCKLNIDLGKIRIIYLLTIVHLHIQCILRYCLENSQNRKWNIPYTYHLSL